MIRVVVGCISLCAACLGACAAGAPARPAMVDVKLHLQLSEKADLKAADVTCAAFPGGKRCAFTFFGCRSPKTIEVLSKLGFRTTVYCSPSAGPGTLRALEAAGADIGIGIWGGKGTYASHIGANTIQGAFDAVVTSRMVLRRSCRGPLACGSIGGHYGTMSFPVNRSPENRSGFGYAYHDANYLLLSDNKPYMVYLRRQGGEVLMNRANYDNRIDSRRVPNEVIYYQILANKFRGTLRRVKAGQIVRFSLRDFKAPDLEECAEVIGPFGKHALIWQGTEADLGANEYIRRKVHVREVKAVGGRECAITLGIEEDAFVPFLVTPLPLALPASVKVAKATVAGIDCPVTERAEATYVDVPLRAALTAGCRMSVKPAAADMTVPDKLELALTLTNPSDKPVTGAKLRWVGNISFRVSGGPGAPFDLPPKGKKEIKAVAATGKGARFGITPFQAVVTATQDGEDRVFMEGFEVVVAPRLRVEVDPMQRIPMPPGRYQHFFVRIDNKKSKSPGGPPNTFISHKAGPCKGTVGFDLPKGMRAEPAQQPFDLAANQEKTLVFKIFNEAWDEEPGMVRPAIRFAGESRAVRVLFPGTTVVRSRKLLDFKPLDEKGLLVYASWDDRTKGANYDRACGSVRCGQSGSPCIYSNEGVKGWCLSARSAALADSFKNIDYQAGTICLWLRKDPMARNENTYVPNPEATRKVGASQWNNRGECIFGMNSFAQIAAAGQSGITLRRYRSWKGKTGYLQATYQGMRRQIRCVQVPYEWSEQWRHVAVLWDMQARRLEIYLDGKLVGKAPPGEEEWHGAPWDRGRPSGEMFSPISCDHGKWTATQRDEFYVYNRPLTPKEIVENMNLAKKK